MPLLSPSLQPLSQNSLLYHPTVTIFHCLTIRQFLTVPLSTVSLCSPHLSDFKIPTVPLSQNPKNLIAALCSEFSSLSQPGWPILPYCPVAQCSLCPCPMFLVLVSSPHCFPVLLPSCFVLPEFKGGIAPRLCCLTAPVPLCVIGSVSNLVH